MAVTSPLEPAVDFRGILKDRETFGTGRGTTFADRLNSWFDTLLLQTGWELAPAVMVLLCVCGSVALGGLIFVIQENLLTAAFGTLVGFVLPVLAAMWARGRRQQLILQQLPAMLEELARAAKTGRSVEQCLQLVAVDTPDPLGRELRLASRRLDLGMPLRDALSDWPQRTGVMTLNILATTLVVQQQTGGDLVTVLTRLSRTVRDRLLFLGRLRAATAASRATAILMIVLPPAVLAFFTLRDPNYFTELMRSTWGRNATLTACVLEIVGVIWVLRILRNSQRT